MNFACVCGYEFTQGIPRVVPLSLLHCLECAGQQSLAVDRRSRRSDGGRGLLVLIRTAMASQNRRCLASWCLLTAIQIRAIRTLRSFLIQAFHRGAAAFFDSTLKLKLKYLLYFKCNEYISLRFHQHQKNGSRLQMNLVHDGIFQTVWAHWTASTSI